MLSAGSAAGRAAGFPARSPLEEAYPVGVTLPRAAASTVDSRFVVRHLHEAKRLGPYPFLSAAATAGNMGAQSYRNGKAYFLDPKTREISDHDPGWAAMWERTSRAGAEPRHVPGWEAGDRGSKIEALEQMRLGGPWVDGKPPEVN